MVHWCEPLVCIRTTVSHISVSNYNVIVTISGVQALIKLIFDINVMKETLLEFEIDLNKMPLGKLSKSVNVILETERLFATKQLLLIPFSLLYVNS